MYKCRRPLNFLEVHELGCEHCELFVGIYPKFAFSELSVGVWRICEVFESFMGVCPRMRGL